MDLKLKPGMTANVGIEINKKTDVIRIPATAVRFRPTEEIFAAFNQPVPAEMQPRGQRGATGGTRMAGGAPAGSGAPAGPAQAAAGGTPPAAGQSAQNQARGESARPSERGGGDRATGGAQPGFTRQGAPGEGRQGAGQGMGQGGFGGGQRGEGGGMGQGGARRGFDANDPEAVARMVQRYKEMPADQKAQWAARMKERGIDIEALAKGAKPGAPGTAAAAPTSRTFQGATTIDALFGALPVRITQGRAEDCIIQIDFVFFLKEFNH